MKTQIEYRDNGAIGAILDEYERAIRELKAVISTVSYQELMEIVDKETTDAACKSIQTILTHVVVSGYLYATEIRKWLGEDIAYPEKEWFEEVKAYQKALDEMFNFNEKIFQDYPNIQLKEYDCDKKVKVRWGQKFDVNQLCEHAIMHVLRHRRQIERFLLKLRKVN